MKRLNWSWLTTRSGGWSSRNKDLTSRQPCTTFCSEVYDFSRWITNATGTRSSGREYKNWEIHNLFVENTPLRRCPHAEGLRVFVKTFLTSMGHDFAAQQIRNAFPDDVESLTHKDVSASSLARHWHKTHVVERHCLYNV